MIIRLQFMLFAFNLPYRRAYEIYAKVLKSLNYKKAVPLLIERYRNPDARQAKYKIIESICILKDRKAVAILIKYLSDNNQDIRALVIETLGAIGGKEAEDALEKVVQRDNGDLKRVAEESLKKIRTKPNK